MAAKKRAKKVVKDVNLGRSFFIPENSLDCSSVHTSLANLKADVTDDMYDGDERILYEVTVVRSWRATKGDLTVTEI